MTGRMAGLSNSVLWGLEEQCRDGNKYLGNESKERFSREMNHTCIQEKKKKSFEDNKKLKDNVLGKI